MIRNAALNWNLSTLTKAYQQGHMAGALGMERSKCPYRGDVVVAAWEAGWEDGKEQPASGRLAASLALGANVEIGNLRLC